MQYKKIWLLLSLLSCFGLHAINQNAGTSGFSFLKIIYSARANALGSAFSAMAEDADIVFYNPGGLVTLNQKQVKTTYMSYLEGYQGGSVVFATKKNPRTAYGVFINYLTSDPIDRTTITPTGEYAGTDGTFSSSEMVAGVVVSKHLSDMVQAGFTAKYFRESIDSYSASGVAVDFGIQHQPVNPKVRIGLAVRNLGTQLTYYTESKYKEKVPMVANAGLRYFFRPNLMGMFELNKPSGQDLSVSLGSEYQFSEMFAGRLGYKTNGKDWKTGGTMEVLSGMSAGLGFKWHDLGLDYAFVSYGDLGSVNQISLRYFF